MKQRKINPEAIKALKRVMPDRETRKMFIDECIKANGKDFESKWHNEITLNGNLHYLSNSRNSFGWEQTEKRYYYWRSIFNNLTFKESKLKIFLT